MVLRLKRSGDCDEAGHPQQDGEREGVSFKRFQQEFVLQGRVGLCLANKPITFTKPSRLATGQYFHASNRCTHVSLKALNKFV